MSTVLDVTTIDVGEAQSQLLQLLTLVLKGGDVVIAKDNIPLVRLVPVKPQRKRRLVGCSMRLLAHHCRGYALVHGAHRHRALGQNAALQQMELCAKPLATHQTSPQCDGAGHDARPC